MAADEFEIISPIRNAETIAAGPSVRERVRLRRVYGRGRWRKMKDGTTVRVADGSVREAEIHWYEVHGIGRKDWKIKRYLD